MKPTPIYRDHTGWREVNPHSYNSEVEYNRQIGEWNAHDDFESKVQYHLFPNPPDVELGIVVMARQIMVERQKNSDDELKPCEVDGYDPICKTGYEQKIIWVLSDQEAKEEQPKDFGNNNHLYNCPFCNGSEKDHVVLLGYKYPKYLVSCCDCGYFIEDDRKDKVLELWNTRNGKGWLQSSFKPIDRQDTVEDKITFEQLLVKAARYGYEYHETTKFPELLFDENCKNNFLQFLQADKVYAELTHQSTKDAKEIVELREEVEKMLEVFKWLMGYYDFPEQPKEGRPRYYWRPYLRAKLKEIGIDIHGCQSPFQPRETDNQS